MFGFSLGAFFQPAWPCFSDSKQFKKCSCKNADLSCDTWNYPYSITKQTKKEAAYQSAMTPITRYPNMEPTSKENLAMWTFQAESHTRFHWNRNRKNERNISQILFSEKGTHNQIKGNKTSGAETLIIRLLHRSQKRNVAFSHQNPVKLFSLSDSLCW